MSNCRARGRGGGRFGVGSLQRRRSSSVKVEVECFEVPPGPSCDETCSAGCVVCILVMDERVWMQMSMDDCSKSHTGRLVWSFYSFIHPFDQYTLSNSNKSSKYSSFVDAIHYCSIRPVLSSAGPLTDCALRDPIILH